MTREQIYQLLLEAKLHYLEINKYNPLSFGMCYSLDHVYYNMTLEDHSSYNYLQNLIPEFSKEFFRVSATPYWWWKRTDHESRIKAFDTLIGLYKHY